MKEKVICALGFFDGVHLGHQALLQQCRALATEYGCRAGAVTFVGHPDALVSGAAPALINTPADRRRLLEGAGMDAVVELPFVRELMTTHWSAFLTLLVEQGAGGFVCGSDFRFGSGGLGTAKKLEAYCKKRGLPVAIVPQQELDGIRVSSTHIRALLEAGQVEQANRFLGHSHMLTGTVVAGRGLGHTIGIPTANVLLPEELAIPRLGVYACTVSVDGHTYVAVTNIGSRPTVGGHQLRAESWLLDYEGDLYGREITLHFHKFLRPEKKFGSLEQLQAQIREDAAFAYAMLK